MTDDATGSDPTSQPGRSWRIPLLVAALVIVIVVAVAVAVGQGNDDDDGTDASSDPTSASTSASTSTSPSASDSASTSDSPSVSASPSNGDPTPSPVINKAAKAAIQDDFPALVPAGVPAGWTVESATYDRKADTWSIELTDPNGSPVRLAQSKALVDDLVAQWLGADAQAAGKVDLSDFGTGKWQAYTSMAGPGIAKALSGTSAVVFGADQDSIIEFAQELLTAEDGGTSDNGG